ncbi:MAG: polyprenyl synthetase family protein, partial [Thiomicrorhabdus sp.]|nr:polyprenyl synthetase family protein [Thiomicrorhabdus sp.]
QVLDIESEGQTISHEQLKQLHNQKTGALIQCALLLGAVQSTNYHEIQPGLVKLGELIGLAFQVHDDILDIEGSTETLGKPQGSDLDLDKSTYPKLLGLEEAKNYRDSLISQAHKELQELPIDSPFLSQLIDYIGQRKH